MTRTATGLCVAAAFGFVASLGAQTPTGTTDQTQRTHSSMSKSDEVTLTGCLEKGADGNYILTHASMGEPSSAMSGATTAGTSGTTAGSTGATTATGSATGATTTAGSSSRMDSSMTWQLSGGKDLDKHVGHKIQVTGRAMSDGSSGNEAAAATTGSTATGSTAATTGSTAGTSGTTAGTMTGTTGESQEHSATSSTSGHRLEVKSVKMVSTSCS